MAATKSNYKTNQIITKKFNFCFLKPYLKKHGLKLKQYRYKEALYAIPFFMFVCDFLWIKNSKMTIDTFANTNIHEVFYNFFFDKKTQEIIYETNGKKFELEDFEKIVKNLFGPISKELAKLFWDNFKSFKHFPKLEDLTEFIHLLLSYFYIDDIILDFGPDINKLIADEDQYERNVQLFTLKLKYLKKIQEMIKDLAPTHANFLLVAINVISKDHKG